VKPNRSEAYYEEQGQAYFDLLSGYDQKGNPSSKTPTYSDFCVRWEWEPWLLLTGKNHGSRTEWSVIDALQKITIPVRISERRVQIFKQVNYSIY
jgi:hypothetical protein